MRRQLFFTATFERDRALARLLEVAPSAAGAGPERRLAPRLERRRRTVSRRQPARQAETLLAELAGSPALLELQYRDEPGSGLGPTLEFYAQVCADVQVSRLVVEECWLSLLGTRSLDNWIIGCTHMVRIMHFFFVTGSVMRHSL